MLNWWRELLSAAAIMTVWRFLLGSRRRSLPETSYRKQPSTRTGAANKREDATPAEVQISRSSKTASERDEKELTFALHGERAKGGLVETGSDFELCLEYRPPAPADLVILRATGLRNAIAANADLEVAIVPGRLEVVDGTYLKVARFQHDALINEVRFSLRATRPTDDAGLHVFVSVKGCLFYDFPLRIRVVNDLHAEAAVDLAAHVPVLDLDAMARVQSTRSSRNVRLVFSKAGGTISVLLHELNEPEVELTLKRFDVATWTNVLKQTAADVREVAAGSFWNTLNDPLTVPEDDAIRTMVRQARNHLISAGSTLHRELMRDKNFAYMLDRIERLPAGSRLSVVSDCGFLPLEIIYPDDFHFTTDEAPTTSRLWGYRFQFEYLLYDSLRTAALPLDSAPRAMPFVSFNLDPLIDEQLKQPGSRVPLPLPVQAHDAVADEIRARGWKVETNSDLASIQTTFRDAHAATLIYYYCHGRSESPFAADPVSRLAFGSQQIDPAWIQALPPFRHAPVIVLNSCSSGEAGPVSLLTFLERFRSKGAAGLISTWFAVPMFFASAFGRELLVRYAASQTIGDALYDLRRSLLDQGHPLGLLYALQCPMDLKAPSEEKIAA